MCVCPEATRTARRRQVGQSLVELVVAIAVISIALTGTMLVVDTTTRRSADPMLERQAISIAEAHLEEVLRKAFVDPDDGALCPPPEVARALFDNICDYAAFDLIGVRDQNGQAVVGLETYRVEIDVDTNASLGGLSGSGDVLRVDTSVTDPMGRVVTLSGYRTSQ